MDRFATVTVPPEAEIGIDENTRTTAETPLHPGKACPVVIRGQGAIEILAFEHPLAGLQLVKGMIEPGESSRDAALRELREESGLIASNVLADLGIWIPGYENQIWAFH